MSITKHNDHYRVFVDAGYDIDGRRIRVSKVATSVREAKRIERELQEDVARSGKTGWRITVADFAVNHYLPSLTGLAPSTVKGYEAAVRHHLVPAIGRVELKDVTPAVIQRMLSGIDTRGGQDNAHKAIRQLFTYAQSLGMATTNPAKSRFTKIQKVPPKEPVLESAAEIAEYVAAIRGCTAETAALLSLGAGLRKGEALGCNWSDIDFNAGTVTVRRSYVYSKGAPDLKAPKTEQSNRTVPVMRWALERLREVRGGTGMLRMGPVCVGSDGKRMHPQTAARNLERAVEQAGGKPVPLKNLRHSFATYAISQGVEVATVSKWLGHTDIMTTYRRYVRVGDNHLHNGVAILDRAYGL